MGTKNTVIWGGAIGALVAYDIACATRSDDSTLSSVLRGHLTTHNRQVLFLGGWTALTAWFIPHILKPLAREAVCAGCIVCRNRTSAVSMSSHAHA